MSQKATEHAIMFRECIDCGGDITLATEQIGGVKFRFEWECADCGLTGWGTLE